jgi:hypothetical protein
MLFRGQPDMRNPLRARLSQLEADYKARPQPPKESCFSFLTMPERILLERIWTRDPNFWTTETPDEIRAKLREIEEARVQIRKDY